MQVRAFYILAFILLGIALTVNAQGNYNLQKALQTAKKNNPTLKTEQFNIAVVQTDIITAGLRPNLIFNNQTLQLVQPSSFPPNTHFYDVQNQQVWFQLTKPFQVPSQRRKKIDVAEKNVTIAQNNFTEIERSLFQEVALKWLDVWTARKKLDVLQIAKNNVDSLVITNRLRLKNLVITETELLRTELIANQYAIQLKSAEQVYSNEMTRLKFLMGIQEDISIDTSDNFQAFFSQDTDTLLSQALNARGDLAGIKSTIDMAGSNIKLQKTFAWPQPELGLIYNPQNNIPYVGFFGTIEIPLFSRNQGDIKKSMILKQQAEQDLLSKQSEVQADITTAFSTYQTQKQNLTNFNDLLKQAETILNNVKYSYLVGGTNIIDFLEAQRSWLDTQQQYYDVMQEYRQSYIRLLYVTGLINQIAQ